MRSGDNQIINFCSGLLFQMQAIPRRPARSRRAFKAYLLVTLFAITRNSLNLGCSAMLLIPWARGWGMGRIPVGPSPLLWRYVILFCRFDALLSWLGPVWAMEASSMRGSLPPSLPSPILWDPGSSAPAVPAHYVVASLCTSVRAFGAASQKYQQPSLAVGSTHACLHEYICILWTVLPPLLPAQYVQPPASHCHHHQTGGFPLILDRRPIYPFPSGDACPPLAKYPFHYFQTC